MNQSPMIAVLYTPHHPTETIQVYSLPDGYLYTDVGCSGLKAKHDSLQKCKGEKVNCQISENQVDYS